MNLTPENAARRLGLASPRDLDHHVARGELRPVEGPTGVLAYPEEQVKALLDRRDQDHLRDDPSLPGGSEYDGGYNARPSPMFRPMGMSAVEQYDFDLGRE